MKINLHIEHLVLNGVNVATDQYHFLSSNVKAELTKLIMDGGLSPAFSQSIALSHISTNDIQLTSSSLTQLSQKTAHSVYRGICRD